MEELGGGLEEVLSRDDGDEGAARDLHCESRRRGTSRSTD